MTNLNSVISANDFLGIFGFDNPKLSSSQTSVEVSATSMQELNEPFNLNKSMMIKESRMDRAAYRNNPDQFPKLPEKYQALIDIE